MKKKIIVIIGMALFFLYPFYPFVHECGHAITTLFFHGTVKSFIIHPKPYVLIDQRTVSQEALYIICLAGIIFPCLFSLLPMENSFIGWSLSLLFRLFGMIGCLSPIIILLFSSFCSFSTEEDILRACSINPHTAKLYFLFIFLFVVQFFLVYRRNFTKFFPKYFI